MKNLQLFKTFAMLMLTLALLMPDRVWAQNIPANVVELKNGENFVNVQNPTTGDTWQQDTWSKDNYTLFRYVAEYNGDVTFNIDTDCGHASVSYYVYNEEIVANSGSFYGAIHNDFYHHRDVKAGDILYIGVRGYGDNVINNCLINVQLIPACASGQHNMEYVAEIPPTCSTDGASAHYHCSKCNFDYYDEAGMYRLSYFTINSLGHDYDSEGNCQREGCGYKVMELNRGDNIINVQNVTKGNEWNQETSNPRHYNLLKYTVKNDGELTITGVGNKNIYAVLFDSTMTYSIEFATNWNSIEDFVYNIPKVKANTVYYIGLRGIWDAVVGDYTINIDATLPPACASGQHVMTLVTGNPATCTESGIVEHYHCNVCERNFADAAGTDIIADFNIKALGHDFGNDGNCQHEGCEEYLELIELTDNDNDVVIQNPTSGEEWHKSKLDIYNYTVFKYVVKKSGTVTIKSVGYNDTYGVLYDASLNYICGNDDGGERNNFMLTIENANAGDIYYIGARGYGDNLVGNYTINVSVTMPSCGTGNHEAELIPYSPATCTTDGIVEHYHCNVCERNFADLEGQQEIDDIIAHALGHDYGDDGKCQHEGCNVSIVVLHDGDNYVSTQSPTSEDEFNENQWLPKHYNLFRYKVASDGDVKFSISADIYHHCIFYDASNMTPYISLYGLNYYHELKDMKAGDVILVGIRGNTDEEISSYNINVQFVPACASGQHRMTFVSATSATCTTNGIKAHYHCSKCTFDYADEVGIYRIVDAVMYSLGHNYDSEGNCQREGCGYKAMKLNSGYNNVNIQDITSYYEWDYEKINPRHYNLFKYTVKAEGDITFKSVGGENLYALLYDSNFQVLDECWGVPEFNYKDMLFNVNGAHAGDVYYIGVRGWGDKQIGDYTIIVSDSEDESVAITGGIYIGEYKIEMDKPGTIESFNNANPEKMRVSVVELARESFVVLTLNGAEITIPTNHTVALSSDVSVPLVIRLTGENTINLGYTSAGFGYAIYATKDIMLAGDGTLNINIDSSNSQGTGIYAKNIVSYDRTLADYFKTNGIENAEDYMFTGTVNIINNATSAGTGIMANNKVFLGGGNYNFSGRQDGITTYSEVSLYNTNVKMEGIADGISTYGLDATASSSPLINYLSMGPGFKLIGGDLEMNTTNSSFGLNGMTYSVSPLEDNDIMIVETGSSKETAQKVDFTNLLDVAGKYLHIYEQSYEEYIATGIGSNLKQNADDEKMYNIMGQRVGKNTKGIVIVNGRAVVRK